MATTLNELYVRYTAACDKIGSLALAKSSFKNKAAVIAAIDELGADDDNELPAATTPDPTTGNVTISTALSKVQRATLRREYSKRGLARPEGWRNASIPADLAHRIGIA